MTHIQRDTDQAGTDTEIRLPGQWDLHIHGEYCNHGSGRVPQLFHSGIKRGLSILGVSEHAPVPGNRWSESRMDMTGISRYLEDFVLAEGGGLTDNVFLLRAMECDYLPDYHVYYQDELLGNLGLDYLIGAVHFVCRGHDDISLHRGVISVNDLARYTEQYIDMIQSGLFLFGAHPDVFGMVYHRWDKHAEDCAHAICEVAAAHRFPLEINGNGFRRPAIQTGSGMQRAYPLTQFWSIAADHGVPTVVNSDAHHPGDVGESLDACIAFGRSLGVRFCNLRLTKSPGNTHAVEFGWNFLGHDIDVSPNAEAQ